MIPVYQTLTVANDGSGNCFNACVASILELPLREVCQVLPDTKGDYWAEWESWFESKGLMLDWRLARPEKEPPKGFAIASGFGGRVYPEGHSQAGKEISHAAVVFNGRVIHDPFPGADKFERITRYWTITPAMERAA